MKIAVIYIISLSLFGCFSSKEIKKTNSPVTLSPLVKNQIQTKVIWYEYIEEQDNNNTKGLQIASNSNMLFLASNSTIYALDKKSGDIVWDKTLKSRYITNKLIHEKTGISNFLFGVDNKPDKGVYEVNITGGPSVYGDLIVVGGFNGEVFFINSINGKVITQNNVDSTIFTSPLIDIDNNQVLVKTINSKVISLSIENANVLWQYSQNNVPLTINGIAPIIKHNNIFITGFDNGRLVFLDEEGVAINEQRTTIPKGRTSIERVIDIDSATIVDEFNIFSVSYQGNLTSTNLETNKINWKIEISSLLGGGIIDKVLYIVDDKSIIHGISKVSGNEFWQQQKLKYRIKTPAVSHNGLIVVADIKGYLHWINPELGNIIGRKKITDNSISKLQVIDDKLFVLDSQNGLFAIQVQIIN